MLCVEPYKGATKKELQLRERLDRVRKLEKACYVSWHRPGADREKLIVVANKWTEETHDLLKKIRALELKNPYISK